MQARLQCEHAGSAVDALWRAGHVALANDADAEAESEYDEFVSKTVALLAQMAQLYTSEVLGALFYDLSVCVWVAAKTLTICAGGVYGWFESQVDVVLQSSSNCPIERLRDAETSIRTLGALADHFIGNDGGELHSKAGKWKIDVLCSMKRFLIDKICLAENAVNKVILVANMCKTADAGQGTDDRARAMLRLRAQTLAFFAAFAPVIFSIVVDFFVIICLFN